MRASGVVSWQVLFLMSVALSCQAQTVGDTVRGCAPAEAPEARKIALLRAQAETTAQRRGNTVSGRESLEPRSGHYDQRIEGKAEGFSTPPEVVGESRVESQGGILLCVDIRIPK